MGNESSFPSFDDFNITKKLSTKDFERQTERKMTIHIISDEKEECKTFVELITNEKLGINADELLEKDIKNKNNLYSFINYKIEIDVSDAINKIIAKANKISSNPTSKNYSCSELIILFDNNNINSQFDIIKKELTINKKNKMFFKQKPYLLPFLIIVSTQDLIINDILPSRIFQFKINPKDIINILKRSNNILLNNKNDTPENIIDKDNNLEKNKLIPENSENNIDSDIYNQFSLFFRKINVIFCYYNELGDEFSFMNSNNEEKIINNEGESDSPVFINILLIGNSGAGKSTLINLILEEKKSLEGGNGFSTTSKNILVYKKANLALRFYDVKGLEDDNTLKNYVKILKDFNSNNNQSIDSINAIFYCKPYGDSTVINENDKKIITELIDFDIPILFLFTKMPYDLRQKMDDETEEFRQFERNSKIDIIESKMRDCFKNKNKESESDNYIKQYIHFYFVNLIEDYSLKVPVFGIDEVFAFFKNLVSEKSWQDLKQTCKIRDAEKCKELCKNNPFLKKFSDIDKLNENNKIEANKYLKKLKITTFFTGAIPFLDMLSETGYRYLFKHKLKVLYGFEYEEAQQNLKVKNSILENKNVNEEESKLKEVDNIVYINNNDQMTQIFDQENFENLKDNNTKKLEKNINKEINNNCNKIKNYVINTGKRFVDVAIPAVEYSVTQGLKTVSYIFLPITMIGSGIWSTININKDCQKYLDIFDKAFTPLRFKVLENYINAFIEVIDDLNNTGKKLVVRKGN